MYTVIDVADLHKRFEHVRALDGQDLQVVEGEIHGFLGSKWPMPQWLPPPAVSSRERR
jgi:ABC-type branched-subunit amino acid transport system ATPase component